MLNKYESKILDIERTYYLNMISKFMAYKIYLRYVMYNNKSNLSLAGYHQECRDLEILSESEINSLYSKVEDILVEKYNLIIANKDYINKPIALADIAKDIK